MQPFVSVIIPCRNEAVSIRRCLESVLASNYPPDRMELLVADGCSQDETRTRLSELAAQDSRIRVLENSAKITPIGLNLAIEEARGEFILRIDAHSIISPDYIPILMSFLETHPEAWGAGGRMHTEPETPGLFSLAIPVVLSHRFGVGNSQFRTAGNGAPTAVDTVFNCCWRRDVFRRIGLFHEKLARSQDMEMSTRIAAAGGTLWRVPSAETTYFARVGFGAYVRHNWMNGVWSLMPALYTGRIPVRWRHLVPLAFVSSILCGLLLATTVPKLWWAPLLPLAPYAAVNLAASITAAWTRCNWRLAILLPATFAGLHFSYGAGSLWGAMRVLSHHLLATETTGATEQAPSTTL